MNDMDAAFWKREYDKARKTIEFLKELVPTKCALCEYDSRFMYDKPDMCKECQRTCTSKFKLKAEIADM